MPPVFNVTISVHAIQREKYVLQQLLNWQFHHALGKGELDFLQGCCLGIKITDINLHWSTTLPASRLVVLPDAAANVWFRAEASDLLLVAACRADADMLFFQRRLVTESDTELGLGVKNLMDARKPVAMPAPLRAGLQQLAALAETEMKQKAQVTASRTGMPC